MPGALVEGASTASLASLSATLHLNCGARRALRPVDSALKGKAGTPPATATIFLTDSKSMRVRLDDQARCLLHPYLDR